MPQEISGKETCPVGHTAEKTLKVVEPDGTLRASIRVGHGVLHGQNLPAEFERMAALQNRDVVQDLQDPIRADELIAARTDLITARVLKRDCGESKKCFVCLTRKQIVG